MATQKKFDIENPADEMIENLEASTPGEEGFHITKLSARDSRRFLEIVADASEPTEEVKANWRGARASYEKWFGPRPSH